MGVWQMPPSGHASANWGAPSFPALPPISGSSSPTKSTNGARWSSSQARSRSDLAKFHNLSLREIAGNQPSRGGCCGKPAPMTVVGTNVRCWESNGLNADVTFGPFMTHLGHSAINFAVMHNSVLIQQCGSVGAPGLRWEPMRRRDLITLLGGVAVAWPLVARAQQPAELRTIGFLGPTTASIAGERIAAFEQRLQELG